MILLPTVTTTSRALRVWWVPGKPDRFGRVCHEHITGVNRRLVARAAPRYDPTRVVLHTLGTN